MKKADDEANVIDMMKPSTASAKRPEELRPARSLTMDVTSMARLRQVVCRVDGEMETIEMPPIAQGAHASNATAVPITDCLSGQTYLLILNRILVSAFTRAGAPLTGRHFAIRAGEIKAGKRYREMDVVELEVA